MLDDMKEDLEEPGAAIGARLKSVKGFPGLQVDFLHQVLSLSPVTHHPHRRAEEVIQVWQRHGLELLRPRFAFLTE
jgi:hypothetical protein